MKDLFNDLVAIDNAFGGADFGTEEFAANSSDSLNERMLIADSSLEATVAPQSPGLDAAATNSVTQKDEHFLKRSKLRNDSTATNAIYADQFDREAALIVQTVPFVVVNDTFGSSGSQDLAAPLDAIVAISDGSGAFCTGALIAPDLVLSARHCNITNAHNIVFGDDINNADMTVSIESVNLPAGPGDILDGGDFALLRLSSPVSSAIAQPLRLVSSTNTLVGEEFTLVGYGINGAQSDQSDTADGLRWAARNVIDQFGEFGGAVNLFLADYDDGSDLSNILDSDPTPIEFEGITTPGDSGGPLLVDVGGELAIAAVTSGGLFIPDNPEVAFAFWTSVAEFESEISSAGGQFVGGSSDGNGEQTLPSSDDHGDDSSDNATELQLQPSNNVAIARQDGVVGYTGFESDVDRFRVQKTNSGRLIVDVKANSSDLDTFVQVFDSNGELVGQNDNIENAGAAANPSDSQVILRNVPAGEYFVAVTSNGDSTGSYRLAVRSNLDTSDPGNSFASAASFIPQIVPSTTFLKSSIDNGADRDFYHFTAIATGRMIVRTKALSGNLNTVLRGFDSSRVLLKANNNFREGLDSRISFNVAAGQSYFLNLNSVGTTSGDYRVSLRMNSGQGSVTPFRNLTLDDPNGLPGGHDNFASPVDSVDRLDQHNATGIGMLASV